MSFFREVWWSFVSTTSVVTLAWVGCTDPAGLLTQPVLPSSVDPGTVCLCTRERGNGWLVEERKLWLLTLWSFFPSFFFFFEEGKGFFFSFTPQPSEPVSFHLTGSGNLAFWVPCPVPRPQSTCTCRHFLNRCVHLPGTTAKPAVITCVKTRVQGINRREQSHL